MYISLLQLSPQPSDVLLKAALLRRAAADVRRIVTFREDKAALQALLQKGSIGDDLWNAFLAAEKELEAEIVEVVNEANSFKEGWGQFIFNSASEVVNNVKQRDMVLQMPKLRAEAGMSAPTPDEPRLAVDHRDLPCRGEVRNPAIAFQNDRWSTRSSYPHHARSIDF